MYLTETEAVIRLLVALAFGAIIGLEREFAAKNAGLRTYSLAALGAALFMVSSLLLGNQVMAVSGDAYDPGRIASTIVQGAGVIAAGIIFASGTRLQGVTTAVGLWVAAAIGMAVGAGYYLLGGATTVITLIVLHLFLRVEIGSRRQDLPDS